MLIIMLGAYPNINYAIKMYVRRLKMTVSKRSAGLMADNVSTIRGTETARE